MSAVERLRLIGWLIWFIGILLIWQAVDAFVPNFMPAITFAEKWVIYMIFVLFWSCFINIAFRND